MMIDNHTNTDTNFAWPDPGEDWFLAQGAALGMDEPTIKFSAALHSLGGVNAKKNSQAAKLAGLNIDRVVAFRLARSVAVNRLLDDADKIKRGKRPPLTEDEIDQKIDDLIRCPDALTVARAVELREKRQAARRAAREDEESDPFLLDYRMARMFLRRKYGASAFMLFWRGAQGQFGHPELYPMLHDVYYLAMRDEPFGRAIWEWSCSELSTTMRDALNSHLADPSWQLEWRKKVWGEINEKPPAGLSPEVQLETANASK